MLHYLKIMILKKRYIETRIMKTQIIEKNSFLKPLGMLMIFFLISVTCFASLVFANQSDSKTFDENQSAFSKTEINTGLQQQEVIKSKVIKF